MKTISIRLEDSIYEELGEMLDAMGQTKQTFYETFTRTALRERSIPFIISAPVPKKDTSDDRKLEAFKRLEASRKKSVERIDHDKETGTMDKKKDGYSSEEIEFAIFCIENIAAKLDVDAQKVYTALAENSDILYEYIIPEYGILHTQGKEYIVNDILETMKERGVKL